MRLSCNGCRVLRKGCSESCSIRPCLQWIKSPEAQSNATVFLAKFYGRAGLLNLINAGPENLRPAVFRSLLYEACGRIVNPIYGSVGLLWSGNWHMCQAAVEAVLKGAPIVRISDDLIAATPPHLLQKSYDIRHIVVSQDNNNKKKKRKSSADDSSAAAATCNKKVKKPKQQPHLDQDAHHPSASSSGHYPQDDNDHSDDAEAGSHVSQAEHNHHREEAEVDEQQQLGLDLTLGFAPKMPAPPTAGERETAAEPGFGGFRFL